VASTKKLTLKCTGISLLADGRQQVQMSKAAEAPTAKTGAATVVNPPDAALTLAIDETESADYAVGKEYKIAITG
jgi:hypothetical protein